MLWLLDLGSGSQIPDEDRKYEMSFWWYYLDLIKCSIVGLYYT